MERTSVKKSLVNLMLIEIRFLLLRFPEPAPSSRAMPSLPNRLPILTAHELRLPTVPERCGRHVFCRLFLPVIPLHLSR